MCTPCKDFVNQYLEHSKHSPQKEANAEDKPKNDVTVKKKYVYCTIISKYRKNQCPTLKLSYFDTEWRSSFDTIKI